MLYDEMIVRALTHGRCDNREGERVKLSAFLLIGLAALVLSGSQSTADPVPERATGIWSTTACGKDGLTLLVNTRIALLIEGQGLETRVAVVPAEWADGSFILRVKGKERERTLPLDDLKHCDALPGSISLLLAEVVAVFGELDDVVALCRDVDVVTARCVSVVVDLIDLTKDGVFSRVELRQAMRAASFFIAYRAVAAQQPGPFVSLNKLYVAQLAASVTGPFVVTHLVDSYDVDGDDAVSPEELLQGRSPEQAVQNILVDLVAKAPPAIVSVLLKAVPAFRPLP